MIKILYTHSRTRLSDRSWNRYFPRLPEVIQGKISRFKKWQDRQAGLFGKLLLMECLKAYGYSSDDINNISFDEFGRPFIAQHVDFSISHSDEFVICAMTGRGRVGIDIEKIKSISLSDFEQYMTSHQWGNIKTSSNKFRIFYSYWTSKESVLKADGRGLSVPLRDVDTDGRKAHLDESVWYITELNVGPDYSCHLATSVEFPEVHISEVRFN